MSESDSHETMLRLTSRAASGDRAAFGELFEHLRPRLAGVVRQQLGPTLERRLEVDDVLQETFAAALRSLDTFHGRDEDAMLRWLGGIASNRIRHHGRQESKRDLAALPDEVTRSEVTASRHLRRDERFDRLSAALETLPAEQREAILLMRIEGLKIREVAERMDRSEGAVKQLMFRGLRALRSTFGDTESLTLPDRVLGGDESDSDGDE